MISLSPTLALALAVLAVYRAAQFIAFDEGPWSIGYSIRDFAGGYDLDENTGEPKTVVGRMIICPYCLGVWFALPGAALYFLSGFWPVALVLAWLGIAGAQAFAQDLAQRRS